MEIVKPIGGHTVASRALETGHRAKRVDVFLLGSSLLAVESSLAVAPFLHAGMGMLILVHCITKSHGEEMALSLEREFMKSRGLSI